MVDGELLEILYFLVKTILVWYKTPLSLDKSFNTPNCYINLMIRENTESHKFNKIKPASIFIYQL